MGMLPGMGKIKEQMAGANIDEKMIMRQRAIISSMTPKERRNPDILKASRKKRIAAGSGMRVEDVNRLLKQHRQMADMMKSLGGAGGKRGAMGKMASMFGMGSGNPLAGHGAALPRTARSAAEADGRERRPATDAAGARRRWRSVPPGLPGLGGKLPGLGGGGFNPFGKKK